MANISYKWSIVDLERVESDGVVYRCHWQLKASTPVKKVNPIEGTEYDSEEMVSVNGAIELTPPPKSELIPFEELSESKVLEWVKNSLGSDVEGHELGLEYQLKQILDEPTASGLPWA